MSGPFSVDERLEILRIEVETPGPWHFHRADVAALVAEVDRLRSELASARSVGDEIPYTDSKTAFMQIGTTPWPQHAVLLLGEMPPLVGIYNGAGMRRLEGRDCLLIEPMLAFTDPAPSDDGEQP